MRTPLVAGPQPHREPTIPEQIEALARLKEQGTLSDAEFEAKKRELLDRMQTRGRLGETADKTHNHLVLTGSHL